jgi:hypothetical protein
LTEQLDFVAGRNYDRGIAQWEVEPEIPDVFYKQIYTLIILPFYLCFVILNMNIWYVNAEAVKLECASKSYTTVRIEEE